MYMKQKNSGNSGSEKTEAARITGRKALRMCPYADINDVASFNECTGLTQFIPETEHEVESFRDMYDIPLSAENVKKTREGEK